MSPELPTKTPPVAPSQVLQEKIDAVRRKHVAVSAGTGGAMALGALIVLLASAMLLDWWLDLPLWARGFMLAWFLGPTSYIAWRFIVTPIRHQPDDDDVALAVERARPQFRSRLISSIQFPRPGVIEEGVAGSLARMTIAETEALARPIDFTEVIPTRDFRKVATWAVAVLALGLFSFMYGGEVSRDLLKRAFLSSTPVPRHTRVVVLTGEPTIGRGDAMRIEAEARGVVPKTGRVVVKAPGRRTQEYSMDKDRAGRFARTLENIQQSFTYTVHLNDGSSRAHRVEVVPRPAAASIDCEQIFPAYTGLPNMKRPLGDLTLLAGSTLKLAAIATKDIERASLKLAGLSNTVPMQVSTGNPRQLTGEFSIPPAGLTGFSIEMLDRAGMESRDPAVYRIDVLPDRAPRVRITYPDRREELVTRYAVLDVGFEASDDFQISKARLRYKVGESEEAGIETIDLEVGTNVVKTMRNRYEWKIRDFQPPVFEGTRIEFWLEVEDNNDVTGPGIGVTEHQLARVVSENEKRADLLNRAGDFLGTINDVTGDQEKLNANLGAIILEKPRAPQ